MEIHNPVYLPLTYFGTSFTGWTTRMNIVHRLTHTDEQRAVLPISFLANHPTNAYRIDR